MPVVAETLKKPFVLVHLTNLQQEHGNTITNLIFSGLSKDLPAYNNGITTQLQRDHNYSRQLESRVSLISLIFLTH